MKFVVTGGSGFIGSHIARYLINHDHEVTVIDDLRRGNKKNLDDIFKQIDFQKTNILDFEKIENICQNKDGIFHQAGLGSVPQSFKEPEEYLKVNAIGTKNFLKIAKQNNLKLVYASSSSVYGNQTHFPIKENAQKNPLNPYGESKLKAEEFATEYAKEGVSVIGLRYFNVFGIGQNPQYAGVIPKFIEELIQHKPPIIHGDGNQIRSFTFIDDVVDANVRAMNSKTQHAFINIAGKKATSINELAQIMINLSGLQIEPTHIESRPGDIKKSQADTSLSKELIDWESKTSLKEGLEKIFPKI